MTEDEFENYMRRQGWQGCNLVNALCPDDLCVRTKAHAGAHMLMTDTEPGRHNGHIRRCMALKGATARELVEEGARRQRELFG